MFEGEKHRVTEPGPSKETHGDQSISRGALIQVQHLTGVKHLQRGSRYRMSRKFNYKIYFISLSLSLFVTSLSLSLTDLFLWKLLISLSLFLSFCNIPLLFSLWQLSFSYSSFSLFLSPPLSETFRNVWSPLRLKYTYIYNFDNFSLHLTRTIIILYIIIFDSLFLCSCILLCLLILLLKFQSLP